MENNAHRIVCISALETEIGWFEYLSLKMQKWRVYAWILHWPELMSICPTVERFDRVEASQRESQIPVTILGNDTAY